MPYVKQENDQLSVCAVELEDFTYVESLPENKDYRSTWRLVEGAVIEDPILKAELVAAEQSASAKVARDESLEALVHDFGDGRVMQVRPMDEQNIRGAIELMTEHSIPSQNWVMADNVKHPVTAEELQEALTAGKLAALAVWDSYDPQG